MVVYVEGKATEVEYFRYVRDRLRIPKELMSIHKAQHTDAVGIIDEVIKAKARNELDSRRGRDALVDRWWAVLDTEGDDIADAVKKAGNNGVYVSVSDLSFEFWLRLHFGYTTKQYQTAQEIINELKAKGYLPTYSRSNKHPDMNKLYPLLPTAMKNARQLRANYTEQGYAHPRTDCDLLLDDIATIAKDGLVEYEARPFCADSLSMNLL